MAFNCYIDETGDEGIETGGSRWFILGALIVDAERDLEVSKMVSRIKTTFGKSPSWPLHWADLKKHDQRLYVCSELMSEDWTFVAIATDKTHPLVTGAVGLKQKYKLYFYSTRLLLERISWYARDHGNQKANLIFEYRSNISYGDLNSYLSHLNGWIPPLQISWPNLAWKTIKIKPKQKSRLLQAVDCVAGALGNGLEYSGYGFTEPRYVLMMKDRFYRRNGNLFSYGLKITSGDIDHFAAEYDFLKQI